MPEPECHGPKVQGESRKTRRLPFGPPSTSPQDTNSHGAFIVESSEDEKPRDCRIFLCQNMHTGAIVVPLWVSSAMTVFFCVLRGVLGGLAPCLKCTCLRLN